ncbi:MAG: hypothetical protein OXC08_16910 [Thiotrichales bacterium]|nr:hypothetical protein [Thiotrichales bacterium]
MRWVASPVMSASSKRRRPERTGTIPITVFRVVVLPAPLRPRSATTAPESTARESDWSTWL